MKDEFFMINAHCTERFEETQRKSFFNSDRILNVHGNKTPDIKHFSTIYQYE
jgi:hypothetical protein